MVSNREEILRDLLAVIEKHNIYIESDDGYCFIIYSNGEQIDGLPILNAEWLRKSLDE